MFPITYLIVFIASIAYYANGFLLQIRRSGSPLHLTTVSIANDGRLISGSIEDAANFTLVNNELNIYETDYIVFVSRLDGTAIVSTRDAPPAGYRSAGFSDQTGYFRFINNTAYTVPERDNVYAINWGAQPLPEGGEPISIVSIE